MIIVNPRIQARRSGIDRGYVLVDVLGCRSENKENEAVVDD